MYQGFIDFQILFITVTDRRKGEVPKLRTRYTDLCSDMPYGDYGEVSYISDKHDSQERDAKILDPSLSATGYIHGITSSGATVCMRVDNYRPSLWVRVPKNTSAKKLREELLEKVGKSSYFGCRGKGGQALKITIDEFYSMRKYELSDTGTRKKNKYLKIQFTSCCARSRFLNSVKRYQSVKVYYNGSEEMVGPGMTIPQISYSLEEMFVFELDSACIQWIRVLDPRIPMNKESEEVRFSHEDIDLRCSFSDISPLKDCQQTTPMLGACVDGEMYCRATAENIHKKDSIPTPEEKRDVCTMIGVTLYWIEDVPSGLMVPSSESDISNTDSEPKLKPVVFDKPWKNIILVVNPNCAKCDDSKGPFKVRTKDRSKGDAHSCTCVTPVEGATVIVVPDEKTLLNRLRDLLCIWLRCQIVSGYNSQDFDFSFWFQRAAQLPGCRFPYMSSFICDKAEFTRNVVTVAEASRNKRLTAGTKIVINMKGMVHVDLQLWAKQNLKLDMYTLNRVAKKIIGGSAAKLDVSHFDINQAWNSLHPNDISKVAAYCVQDCVLTCRLDLLRSVSRSIKAFCEISTHPFEKFLTSTSAPRNESIVVHYALKFGFMMDGSRDRHPEKWYNKTWWEETTGRKLEGGTVLTPVPQINNVKHRLDKKKGVACLDFASLYPSIMRGYNVGPSNYIPPDEREEYAKKNVELEKVEGRWPEEGYHTFIKVDFDDPVTQGVIPRIESILKTRRDMYKKIKSKGKTIMSDTNNLREELTKYRARGLFGSSIKRDAKDSREIFDNIDSIDSKVILMKLSNLWKAVGNELATQLDEKTYTALEESVISFDPELHFDLWMNYLEVCLQIGLKLFKSGDILQAATKVFMNAIYGTMSVGFLPAPACADAITTKGGVMIRQCIKIAIEHGCTVIYGDTDSVFVIHNSLPTDKAWSFFEKLAQTMSDTFPGVIEMEMEKMYSFMISQAAKQYAGDYTESKAVWEKFLEDKTPLDSHDLKGDRSMKRDSCALLSRTAKLMDKAIIKQEPDFDAAAEILRKMLLSVIDDTAPISDYMYTLGMKGAPAYSQTAMPPAQIIIACAMNAKCMNTAPQIGSRLQVVICEKADRSRLIPHPKEAEAVKTLIKVGRNIVEKSDKVAFDKFQTGRGRKFKSRPKYTADDKQVLKARDVRELDDPDNDDKIDRLYYLQKRLHNAFVAKFQQLMGMGGYNVDAIFKAAIEAVDLQKKKMRCIFEPRLLREIRTRLKPDSKKHVMPSCIPAFVPRTWAGKPDPFVDFAVDNPRDVLKEYMSQCEKLKTTLDPIQFAYDVNAGKIPIHVSTK